MEDQFRLSARKQRALMRYNRKLKIYTPQIREYAFIIGAMKCGTTTLYEYLARHPQVYPNLVAKEPEFFSRSESPENLRDYFRQWLVPPAGRAIALDGSTGYTKRPNFPNVAARLARLEGKKHFIYMVRDPISRIESHIVQNMEAGFNKQSFKLEELYHHIKVSSYAYQLEPYRDAFPVAEFLIIDLADFAQDPIGVVEKVHQHLGLHKQQVSKIAPMNSRSSKGESAKFRLPDEVKQQLRAKLAPEMKRFQEEWNFDVRRWGFN